MWHFCQFDTRSLKMVQRSDTRPIEITFPHITQGKFPNQDQKINEIGAKCCL